MAEMKPGVFPVLIVTPPLPPKTTHLYLSATVIIITAGKGVRVCGRTVGIMSKSGMTKRK